MVLQSIIFNKSVYNLNAALHWLKDNKIIPMKVHNTKNFIRFRIRDPNELRKQKYTHFYTKSLDNGNVKLIIAYN